MRSNTVLSACSLSCAIAGIISTVGQNAAAQVPPAQSPSVVARAQTKQARSLLESGDYRGAKAAYATILDQFSGADQTLRAAAHFGRAFAEQQRWLAGDTVDQRVVVDSVLSDYRSAAMLDGASLGAAASNNIGIVLRAAGRHQEAARYFATAAEVTSPERGTFLVNLGKAYEALGQPDSALAVYRRAVGGDADHAEALRSLFDLLVRRYSGEATLAEADRWRRDTANAKVATGALLALLRRKEPSVSEATAAAALVSLAAGWPVVRMAPSYFDMVVQQGLQRVPDVHPTLSDAVAALTDACASRPPRRIYEEPPQADWWHSTEGGTGGRRAVWSALLRSMGDVYNQRNDVLLAQSYYEAAIGWSTRRVSAPWVDRTAFLPLALIYAKQADKAPASAAARQSLEQFSNSIFDDVMIASKGDAYARGDWAQIHDFHVTLGAYYAWTEKWTGPGITNAEFQLEHMRLASKEIEQRTGKPVSDPPGLLESLADHYIATGKPELARPVIQQVAGQYQRAGDSVAARAVLRKLVVQPPAKRPN